MYIPFLCSKIITIIIIKVLKNQRMKQSNVVFLMILFSIMSFTCMYGAQEKNYYVISECRKSTSPIPLAPVDAPKAIRKTFKINDFSAFNAAQSKKTHQEKLSFKPVVPALIIPVSLTIPQNSPYNDADSQSDDTNRAHTEDDKITWLDPTIRSASRPPLSPYYTYAQNKVATIKSAQASPNRESEDY